MNYLEKNDNGMTYYEFGSGDTLCILLSGWGTPYALADMYHLSTQLASDFRAIVIDRRGYSGFNEHITERSFNNVCMEIADIIEREADGKKVVIIGHSLGGAYGLYLAQHYTHLIESVICLDMIPYMRHFTTLIYGLNNLPAYPLIFMRKVKLLPMINGSTVEKALRLDSLPSEIKSQAIQRSYHALYNKNVMNELKHMSAFIKGLKESKTVNDVPILIIASEKTLKVSKASLNRFMELFSRVTLYDVGKSSHYVHHDKLEMVHQQILRHCMK